MEKSKLDSLEISQLKFDPDNPRLPTSKKSDSDSEVINYMIKGETLFDLVSSIGSQGYFEGEPLLVVQQGEHFIVVEGNRRLAALKLLNNPGLATVRPVQLKLLVDEVTAAIPQKVPCIIFNHRDDIIDYLGYRHITGVDQWDSLAKARFLRELYDRHSTSFENKSQVYKHLAKLIGSRSDYVKKLLSGYTLYKEIESNDFYDIEELGEEKFPFSVLTTAVSYANISKFVGLDAEANTYNPERLRELTKYLFEIQEDGSPRIPESRSLKAFNAVVDNPRAYDVFVKGADLDEASLFTNEPEDTFLKLLRKSYQFLKASEGSIHIISEFSQPEKAIDFLEKLRNMSIGMRGSIKSRTEEY